MRVGQRLEIPGKSLAKPSVNRQPVRVVERPRTDSGSHHVVSRGDTLSELARAYSTSASAIQSMNGLRSAHRLRIGQRLEIPSKSLAKRSVNRQPVRVVERPRTDSGSHHVVSRGDTLSELAKAYRTSASAIQSMNGLRSAHRLRIGQRLEIPSRSSAKRSVNRRPVRVVERPRTNSGSHHVVSRGDTLWDIARFYGHVGTGDPVGECLGERPASASGTAARDPWRSVLKSVVEKGGEETAGLSPRAPG